MRSERATSDQRRLWLAYALAIATTMGTLLLRLVMGFKIGDPLMLILFLIPIILSAYVGGLRPGLVATMVAALVTNYVLIPPQYSFSIASGIQSVQWVILIVTGVLVSVLNEGLHRARQRAEANQRLQAVTLASIGDAVMTTDARGGITFLNAEAEHLTGWTNAEAAGQALTSVFRIINEQTRQPVEDPVTEVLRSGRTVSLANHTALLARDGRETPIEDSGAPIKQADGKVQGVVLVFRDCSERQRAGEALRESEERLQTVIENLTEGLIISTLDGQLLHWNRAALEMHGYRSLDECLLKLPEFTKVFELSTLDGEVLSLEQWPLPRVMRGENLRDFEVRVRRIGTDWERVFSYGGAIVSGPSGKPLAFLTVTDITERQRAEQQLRLQVTALEAAANGIAITERSGKIVWVNQAFCTLTGYSADEIIGQNPRALKSGAHDRAFYQDMWRTVISGKVWHGELVNKRKDGSLYTEEMTITPVVDTRGEITHFIGVKQDVTERKRAEEALRNKERWFRALIEHSADSIAVIDQHNNIQYLSPAVTTVEGYAPEELIGRSSVEHTHPDDLPLVEKVVAQLLAQPGKPVPVLWRRRHKNGQWIWLEGIANNLLNDPAVQGIVTNYRDVTDRKRAEALQLRTQKLEALGTMAGGIAHDFNNILLAITGNTQLAATDLPPDHPVQESLTEIAKASARATDLVRRILTFSSSQEQKRAVSQLQPVVEEALKLVRATLPAMIEIRTDFAANAPAVAVDTTQIHQIIVNLATNAAHAIGSRSGLIELRLETINVSADLANISLGLREGSYVRLSVSDNGCGMDRATLERIFDPFFTTKPPGVGTGLGLSVVHGIIKSHDGAITVYSQPEKGTAFHLYFPAVGGEIAAAAAAQREALRGRGERLMYVDDEQALVFLAKRMLKRLGYDVTGYTNPAVALREFCARPQDFDLIVTDLSMPHMSGFDLAREMFAVRPDVPILMISGYVRPEDRETALRIGIRELILKPNTIEELGRSLDRLFRGGESSSDAAPTLQ